MIDNLSNNLIITVSLSLLLLAIILAGIRIVKGPSVADRVVALDLLSLLGVGSAGLASLLTGSDSFLDITMAIALIGFLASLAFAAFIERGSIQEKNK